jgi:hypothetical protein
MNRAICGFRSRKFAVSVANGIHGCGGAPDLGTMHAGGIVEWPPS